ncbi:MAG: hypothetical protein M0Q51_15060 [Bacteroidales bacterium]|nr:hypothetical protein [Bacteroidales bacterium]
MRSKFIFIILLLALLVFTVYKMMQFESFIREERKVKLYVEDESKPLLSKFSDEDLKNIAMKSDYYFIATGNYFKGLNIRYLEDDKQLIWEDLFLKGVNLGVAVPGKFPAEFSLTFKEYLEWMRLIGEMNANIIRIYTILPPEFYEAFAYYNLHYFDKPVYLMQGVWAEVPASENYYDPDFVRDFENEIIDVLDVIHGNAVLKERAGKASGVYSSDVSRYVVSLLLGREWEPGSVFKTNQINAVKQYNGDFVSMNDGNAMEAWLAEMMDFAVLYETQQYWFQHPVSFVNWLPLDPMYHNTEIIENNKVREYDNDLESIDFMKFHATELFFPGIYAAYHVYPYYPDFIYLQDSYIDSPGQDSAKDSYFQYLKDIKQHTQGMPLIIAEYGLPSSRGNSHFSPFGFHQGGHSEADQARLSLILTQDIVNTSCAGAIYFEWIDEWFKHNWLVMDFEQPADDRKLWHNMENPEQNFGILALENKIKTIDGDLKEWNTGMLKKEQINLLCDADATYFYIASVIPGFDFNRFNFYLAIDTYDEEKGDHRLPFSPKVFDNGFEFLLELKSTDSAFILVDGPYSVFTDIYNGHIPVYASEMNDDGKFIHQFSLTNRNRVSLTGQRTDSVVVDRSPLIHGNSSYPEYSNADWYFNDVNKSLEIRLDWHLLNISDPAKRFALDDIAGTSDIEYVETDAFKMFVFVTDKNNALVKQYPEDDPYSFIWDKWQTPEYTKRLKPIYFTLQDYFKNLSVQNTDAAIEDQQNESFRITDYFNNKDGAVSISFDNASFSQYLYGLPVLKKYGLSASFGVIPELLVDAPRLYELEEDALLKRLSTKEVKEIAIDHDIAFQPLPNVKIDDSKFFSLEEKSETVVRSLHWNKSSFDIPAPHSLMFVRKSSQERILHTNYAGIKYSVVHAGFSQSGLDSILRSHKQQWTIMVYHHLYESQTEIPRQISKDKADKLFIQKSDFDQQVRLLRNSNYWISSETSVFKYRKERIESSIQTEQFKNMIFLKVINRLDADVYDHPLTLEFKSNARIIKLEGSESDGTYSNKKGFFIFNALPNKEVTIEIVE